MKTFVIDQQRCDSLRDVEGQRDRLLKRANRALIKRNQRECSESLVIKIDGRNFCYSLYAADALIYFVFTLQYVLQCGECRAIDQNSLFSFTQYRVSPLFVPCFKTLGKQKKCFGRSVPVLCVSGHKKINMKFAVCYSVHI